MRFVTLPFRNLRRRPLRSALTVAGISTAIALFVILVGMSRGVESAYVGALRERDTHVVAVRKGVIDILSGSIDQTREGDLRRVPHVREVSSELIDWVTLDSGHSVVIVGWPSGSFLWKSLVLESGTPPGAGGVPGVVVGQTIAEAAGLRVGDPVPLYGARCLVTGIARTGGVIKSGALTMTLEQLQKMTDRRGKTTVFNIRLDAPYDEGIVSDTLSRLSRLYPDLSFLPTSAAADENQIVKMLRAFSWGTSTIAVVIGTLTMLITLLMSVTERTREIGILSALGWQPARILAMIVTEGIIVAALSAVAGTLLGAGGLHLLAHAPATGGFIESRVTLPTLIEVTAAALFIGGAGSIYPAWRAIQLRPAEAIRNV